MYSKESSLVFDSKLYLDYYYAKRYLSDSQIATKQKEHTLAIMEMFNCSKEQATEYQSEACSIADMIYG
jgi:hypothetical protein